jgi:cation diffusion facilitator CzcD-associated flavoprotein CzcO
MLTDSVIPGGLEQLEAALHRDLEILDYPRRPWVISKTTTRGEPILDCLVIGGGQGGLAVAFGLMREKVTNLLVVDENPDGQEGPWRNFARMITLRTPKHLIGPDWGIPNLTIRSWYEAQYGIGAWEELALIPKETWADYLRWFRSFLKIPVRNQVRAGAVQWNDSEDCFLVPITTSDGEEVLRTRTVVLATGIEGSGRWQTPSLVRESLPPNLWAHTHQDIDFASLKNKRVGILGAGACAFDNAAVALESQAAEVHQFFRRREMVRVNPYRWAEFVGFLKHHADLPDDQKWRFIRHLLRMGQLPPANTYARATAFENHYLHPGSPWTKIEALPNNSGARITTPSATADFDFLIVGTGFETDLSVRPELGNLYPKIALWRDRYTPPSDEKHEDLSRHPYLGLNFEFTEKEPGTALYLAAIFNYTFGCLPSLGFGGASISGMKYSLPRVVAGVTRRLYRENIDHYFDEMRAYDVTDF